MLEEDRNCYSESLNISVEDILEMMILDACFIVEVILKLVMPNSGRPVNNIFNIGLIYSSILYDLALAENQLPFFMLWKLLDMVDKDLTSKFIKQILTMHKYKLPGLRVDTMYDNNSIKKVKHLVDLLHTSWLPSEKAIVEYNEAWLKNGNWPSICCAMELREAGIQFKTVETEEVDQKISLFDVKFKNGILEIPRLTVSDRTESLYRNLVVCEQFDNRYPAFLIDYIVLMDFLINTGKYVELLCEHGNIDNLLGNGETVAAMFNRLGDEIGFSREGLFYVKLYRDDALKSS
ncbi:hypothetical protein SLA2020_106410 [Shorea laevis]